MNGSFVLTNSAERDLEEISEYVLEHSGAFRALHVLDRLFEGFAKFGAAPGIGHQRPDLPDQSLRVWSVFSYLVVYNPASNPVEIIRIIHGARDLAIALDEQTGEP